MSKALLFCDLRSLGNFLRGYALLGVVLALSVGILPILVDGDVTAAGLSPVQGVLASVFPVVVSIYALLGLYGADERNGWEEARLTLPVTRSQVVVSRYVFLLVLSVVFSAAGNVLGIVAGCALGAIMGTGFSPDLGQAAMAFVAIPAICLVLYSIMCPVLFRVGLTKGRMVIVLPCLLPLLLNVIPNVDKGVDALAAWVRGLVQTMGPVVPMVGGVLIVLAVYLVSSRIAVALYRGREL